MINAPVYPYAPKRQVGGSMGAWAPSGAGWDCSP